MTTIYFDHVYVKARAAVGGILEREGPLKDLFDKTYSDSYCGVDSFEKAERVMIYDSCDAVLRKAKLQVNNIDIVFGGDLMNQLSSSHYFARDIPAPFVGIYAACATSSLVIGNAAIWIEQGYAKNAMAFTASHAAAAERQYRYPNEYGIQKKETTTTTVSGAGSIILSHESSSIRITSFTCGRIIDWDHTDANDMGLAMAPAAYDTLITHLQDTQRNLLDYDLIATGDLSKVGHEFLVHMLQDQNLAGLDHLFDCGLIIYDIKKQNVFCGGSGCACSMCVSMTYLLDKIEKKQANRILVLATGALLSPVAIQQKESIPCIAHAIVYERSE